MVLWLKCPLHSRLYQVFYGLMVCPWYAYSQTMISEVSPLPQMYASPHAVLFFLISQPTCQGSCSLHCFLLYVSYLSPVF